MACSDDVTLPPLIKGLSYHLPFKVKKSDLTYVDFATTEAYLYFFPTNGTGTRLRLDWVPTGTSIIGAYELIGGIPYVTFRLSAAWTIANLAPGDYTLLFRVGDLTGTSNYGKQFGPLTVQTMPDGLSA